METIKRQIVGGVLCAVIGLAGAVAAFVFLSLAIFFGLAEYLTPGWAAALTGAIVLVTAMITILIVRLVMRERPRVAPARATAPPPSGGTDYAAELGALFGEQARDFAKRNSTATLIGSVVLGFAIGVSPSLRDAIRRALFR